MEDGGIENGGHRKDLVFLYVHMVGLEKVKWWKKICLIEKKIKHRKWYLYKLIHTPVT